MSFFGEQFSFSENENVSENVGTKGLERAGNLNEMYKQEVA
jgi:hypothetical protein